MDNKKEEYRLKKQAYKREKKRHVTLWKRLCLAFLSVSILLTLLSGAAWTFDHITAKVTGDQLWTLTREDPQAVYYHPLYESADQRQEAEAALRQQSAEESLVLLQNAQNVLPLAADTVLRLEGGTAALQEALQQVGFRISEESQNVIAVVNADTKQSYLTPLVELRNAGNLQMLILLVAEEADPGLWRQLQADGVLYIPVWEDGLIAKTLAGHLNPTGSLAAAVALEETQDAQSAYIAAVIGGEEVTYEQKVCYPLGKGLHYTSFFYGAPKVTEEKESVTVTVDVTNAGAVSGKEILQLYVVDPQGELTLAGFAKTDTLEPGATETVAVTVITEELEAGIYCFVVAADAYAAANHYLASLGHTPEDTGNPAMVIPWTYPGRAQNDAIVNSLQVRNAAPVMGAKNGLKLMDLQGVSFDDPRWQQLLDQLRFLDMVSLVADGGLYLPAISSVNAPGCGIDSGKGGEALSLTVPATTWNCDLAYQQGKLVGDWYLEHQVYLVGQENEDADHIDACVIQAMQTGKAKGMAECGIVAANMSENAPSFGSWEGELSRMSICQDLNYLPAAISLLQKEADVDALWALRDACHRNLYALVNSAAMNHMGADTKVAAKSPLVVMALMILCVVCWCFVGIFAALWSKGKTAWKNTQEYLDFKQLRKGF